MSKNKTTSEAAVKDIEVVEAQPKRASWRR
jgi:hypothetical protein